MTKNKIASSDQKPLHRSGFVAVVGRPNVGKSTLINELLKQKIAAVSPRPQTTRRRQLGILTLENAQIVFLDTPGMHHPHNKLGEFMNGVSQDALQDADVILWMVEANAEPSQDDQLLTETIAGLSRPALVLLVLNKIDLVTPEQIEARKLTYLKLLPQAHPYVLSALTGLGSDELLEAVVKALPQGESFYDEEQVTDFYERDIAAELIREGALLYLHEEVPHCVAVRIDEYTERGDKGAFIGATIFVEKESQKGIVIGQGGEMLKKIGSSARKEIENMSGRKVFLEIRVKVSKNWRDDTDSLRMLGYVQQKEG
ncbi:MAG TPA: GTPase Era [Anaerolineaceae bacterium]|nr:GTPase Era [Anaerolineaceae bacterium]